MTWPTHPLSEIAAFVGGGTPSKSRSEFWTGSIPWVSPKDMREREIFDAEDHVTSEAVASSATQIVPSGSVLVVARSGILARHLPIAIARRSIALNQDMKALLPTSSVLPEYLAYAIESQAASILAECVKRGATVHSLDISKFKALKIPKPPLPEQRRIVEILDEADRLRNLRAEADAKADRILPALFIKMFGDPATNQHRWREVPIRSFVAAIKAGWSAPSESRLRLPHEFGVLKVSAVTSGRFRPSEHKAVSEIPPDATLVTPARGDLLMSRANTRELVAATCLVDRDEPKLFLSDKLWLIVPDPLQASGPFLKQLFSIDAIRDRLRARSTGTSGSMLNLSQEAFLGTTVPLPPLPRQQKFSSMAWNLTEVIGQGRTSSEILGCLWRVILNRAFTGKLTERPDGPMSNALAQVDTR